MNEKASIKNEKATEDRERVAGNIENLQTKPSPPEFDELIAAMTTFAGESDRGVALVSAAIIDERLLNTLSAFLLPGKSTDKLLHGFNTPLGTLSARTSSAHSLGLIEDHELTEIDLVRRIRNAFGHSWSGVSFSTGKVHDLTMLLPHHGTPEEERTDTPRRRFEVASSYLFIGLMWRAKLAGRERRHAKKWPSTGRSG